MKLIHIFACENTNLFQQLRHAVLNEGVRMQENGSDNVEIVFYLGQYLMLVDHDCPRLHPSGHWQNLLDSSNNWKYTLKGRLLVHLQLLQQKIKSPIQDKPYENRLHRRPRAPQAYLKQRGFTPCAFWKIQSPSDSSGLLCTWRQSFHWRPRPRGRDQSRSSILFSVGKVQLFASLRGIDAGRRDSLSQGPEPRRPHL